MRSFHSLFVTLENPVTTLLPPQASGPGTLNDERLNSSICPPQVRKCPAFFSLQTPNTFSRDVEFICYFLHFKKDWQEIYTHRHQVVCTSAVLPLANHNKFPFDFTHCAREIFLHSCSPHNAKSFSSNE